MQLDDRLINQTWPPCLRFLAEKGGRESDSKVRLSRFHNVTFLRLLGPSAKVRSCSHSAVHGPSRCGLVHSSVSGTYDINDI